MFASEPALLDPGIVWAYNTLTFTIARASEEVRVVLTPGYGELEIQWRQGARLLVDLRVADVRSLGVEMNSAHERLMAFRGTGGGPELILELEPESVARCFA